MLTYAVITPACNEVRNLPRLAASLLGQTVPPRRWVIVENGSHDGTAALARDLDAQHDSVIALSVPPAQLARGAPIVRAFHAGLNHLGQLLEDIVVKLDADVSLAPDHFESLLAAFDRDSALGIASGACFDEAEGGNRFLTGDHVWGAARAYRRECLTEILPLEERMGWDTVDELKAAARGFRTGIIGEATFRHHRLEGERDGSRWRAWSAQGDVAWYIRYRPLYLLARTLYQATREPAALAILAGYAGAAARRTPRLRDRDVTNVLRRQQRLRELPARAREALGHQ